MIRAQNIYRFADIISQYRPIADISVSVCVFSDKRWHWNCYLRLDKKAWTSDLKWCNHTVCPAEGGPLFKLVISEVFTGQNTDVWNEVCWISCLHYASLLHVFDKHIQNTYIEY